MTSTRSALEITEWGELEQKESWNTRKLALAAVLGSVYAGYVTVFGFASFSALQFRIVDALLPLAALLVMPAVVDLTVGTLLGNLTSPFGPIDIVGGTTANLLATSAAMLVGRRKFKGAWVSAILLQIAIVTVVVGSYVVVATPEIPLWVGWLTFLGGEVLPIGILGYPLLRAMSKTTLIERLKGARNPS